MTDVTGVPPTQYTTSHTWKRRIGYAWFICGILTLIITWFLPDSLESVPITLTFVFATAWLCMKAYRKWWLDPAYEIHDDDVPTRRRGAGMM